MTRVTYNGWSVTVTDNGDGTWSYYMEKAGHGDLSGEVSADGYMEAVDKAVTEEGI